MEPEIKLEQLGELHPPQTLFLRVNVGTAKDQSGGEYEMTVSAVNYEPIVKSEQSGRYFTLAWQDLIALAVARGIDKN